MQNITVEELKSGWMPARKLNIVDVREPYENAEFNIGGDFISVWEKFNP